MPGDDRRGFTREYGLPTGLSADVQEHLIAGHKRSIELDSHARENGAFALSLIPPEDAEIFIHRAVVAEAIEDP